MSNTEKPPVGRQRGVVVTTLSVNGIFDWWPVFLNKKKRWPAEFPLEESEDNSAATDLEQRSALFPHGTVSADWI
jgi:hypothetical protein